MSNARRQELYNQIRETSKDEFILSEMIRLGFWSGEEGETTEPAELIKSYGKLSRELNDLLKKEQQFKNKEKLLREMRKKRMEEAKARRQETKEKQAQKRAEKAEAWTEKQTKDIIYLGKDVSAGLGNKENNPTLLSQNNLPHFADVVTLAESMGIDLATLRFFAFSRKTSKVSHYKRFYLPKKSGGKRLISAPMPRLKALQYWILENILYKITNHEAAHGFIPKKSIMSNAQPHVGSDVVINLDLKNFFPSISYKRVKGLFAKLGYSEQIATILGLLCTESDVDEVTLDGQTYFVEKSERHLPQGAPTSPAITNIMCYRLDKRFEGLAKKFGWTYTRYADDLTFSASDKAATNIGAILRFSKSIIEDEGFVLHPDKIRVMRKGNRQEVTGIVVNDKLGIDRKTLRKFRALLHQIERDGFEGKKWGHGNIRNTIQGYANFVAQVKPEQGAKLKQQVRALLNKPALKTTPSKLTKTDTKLKTTEKTITQPKKTKTRSLPWWRLW